MTISEARLHQEAAQQELVFDAADLGGTGFHPHRMDAAFISVACDRMRRIQLGEETPGDAVIGRELLRAAVSHLARPPRTRNGGFDPGRYGRIVNRAREFIAEHLSEPITVDEIAEAAFTSRRTLFRAFSEILCETPSSHVRRLRLHRIRKDLASEAEAACTIALVANRWGISDLGRMAGWYRILFEEKPSETVMQAVRCHQFGTERTDPVA